MPRKEGFRILNAQQNAAISEDRAKKAAEGMNTVVRRKLADISNLPQNRKLIIEEKSQSIETAAKEYINQLQKENMAMVKMLAQRDKIIELHGIELDRVRVNLVKMQEQNKQLANSNAQMLVELNSGKDRLKMLQHELGCVTGLLKARKLVLEGRAMTKPSADADAKKLIKSQEEIVSTKEDIGDEKPHETTSNSQQNGVNPSESEQAEYKEKTGNKRLLRRRQSARFKVAEVEHADDLFDTNNTIVSASQMPEDSVGEQVSTSDGAEVKNKGSTDDEKPHETTRNSQQNGVNPSVSEQVENKEKTENKRLLQRRQSARFKVAEVEHAEDLFDTNKTVVSSQMPEDSVGEQGSTSEGAEVKNKSSTDSSGQEFGKSSLLRPSRAAAKKVQSYKERPVHIKLRRSE